METRATNWRISLNNYLQAMGAGHRFRWNDSQRGPQADPIWRAIALIDGVECGRGEGQTKRAAREQAARQWLQKPFFPTSKLPLYATLTNNDSHEGPLETSHPLATSQSVSPTIYHPSLSPAVYKNLLSFIRRHDSLLKHSQIAELATEVENMASLSCISSLIQSARFRDSLKNLCVSLNLDEDSNCCEAVDKDDEEISDLLRQAINSDVDKKLLQELKGEEADQIMELLFIHKKKADQRHDHAFSIEVTKLLFKLIVTCDHIPPCLFLHGITTSRRDDFPPEPTNYGSYANIYYAQYNGRAVALKCPRELTGEEHFVVLRAFIKEVVMLQDLRHDYVLPFLGIDMKSFSAPSIVTPWMKNGNLLEYLKKRPPSKSTYNRLVLEIAYGLAYLHSRPLPVVHGDLCARNILVDDKRHVKIAGSLHWMAPELLAPIPEKGTATDDVPRKSRKSPASDVYAFGCTIWEVYTGYL